MRTRTYWLWKLGMGCVGILLNPLPLAVATEIQPLSPPSLQSMTLLTTYRGSGRRETESNDPGAQVLVKPDKDSLPPAASPSNTWWRSRLATTAPASHR